MIFAFVSMHYLKGRKKNFNIQQLLDSAFALQSDSSYYTRAESNYQCPFKYSRFKSMLKFQPIVSSFLSCLSTNSKYNRILDQSCSYFANCRRSHRVVITGLQSQPANGRRFSSLIADEGRFTAISNTKIILSAQHHKLKLQVNIKRNHLNFYLKFHKFPSLN